MSYIVSGADKQKIVLNEADTVAAVLQNVRIILRTVQGSCPLYRQFGFDAEMLDKPIPVAKMLMMSAVREAVEAYEPRVQVLSIDYDTSAEMTGRLVPIVEVEIIE